MNAIRSVERHGGVEVMKRVFTGFAALPRTGGAKPWYEVFGCRSDDGSENSVALSKIQKSTPYGSRRRLGPVCRAAGYLGQLPCHARDRVVSERTPWRCRDNVAAHSFSDLRRFDKLILIERRT